MRSLSASLLRLGENLDWYDPNLSVFLEQTAAFFLQQTGDAVASQQMALEALTNLRLQSAASLAYFDVFWGGAMLGVALVLLVFFMKRSVQEKGTHISAE